MTACRQGKCCAKKGAIEIIVPEIELLLSRVKDEATSRAVDHGFVVSEGVPQSDRQHRLTVAFIEWAHTKLSDAIFAQLISGSVEDIIVSEGRGREKVR